jgi:hypothetical protein
VVRFNAEGPEGRATRKVPGPRTILNDGHRRALEEIIETGPIPAAHGVVRWRIIDLAQWLWDEFKLSISKQALGHELRTMGYRKLSARSENCPRITASLPGNSESDRNAKCYGFFSRLLEEIAFHVAPGAHAVLLLDQAGWHGSAELLVPPNITLMPLPPRCPELNPVENVWQFMRDNWLSNRIFKSYDDVVDHCCFAWNKLADQPWRIMSLGLRTWAHRF